MAMGADGLIPAEPFAAEGVRGFLHRPQQPEKTEADAQRGLVLTHVTGGNCNAPLLVAVANAFAQAGVYVLRCDLPFRQERPSGPPHPAKAARDLQR